MFLNRGRGGPKPSKWKAEAKLQFCSFFGKRSGGVPLPTGPSDAPGSEMESEMDMSAESADERDEEAAGAPAAQLPPAEEDVATTPLEQKIQLARALVTLLVATRDSGIKSQARSPRTRARPTAMGACLPRRAGLRRLPAQHTIYPRVCVPHMPNQTHPPHNNHT